MPKLNRAKEARTGIETLRARLKPLLAGLAGLADLIPWLKQWHNAPDPNLGMGLGDYFAGFLDEQCRELAMNVVELDGIRMGTPAGTRREGMRKRA